MDTTAVAALSDMEQQVIGSFARARGASLDVRALRRSVAAGSGFRFPAGLVLNLPLPGVLRLWFLVGLSACVLGPTYFVHRTDSLAAPVSVALPPPLAATASLPQPSGAQSAAAVLPSSAEKPALSLVLAPGIVPAAAPAALKPTGRAPNAIRPRTFMAPLATYKIDSPFGWRRDPFTGKPEFHTGLDLAAPFDAPVFSAQAGTVTFRGRDGAYGYMIEIDHGNGLVTRYAHLQRILVDPGQHVRAHAEIGLLGSTGRSTGPHLHYEVLVDGKPRDPHSYL